MAQYISILSQSKVINFILNIILRHLSLLNSGQNFKDHAVEFVISEGYYGDTLHH